MNKDNSPSGSRAPLYRFIALGIVPAVAAVLFLTPAKGIFEKLDLGESVFGNTSEHSVESIAESGYKSRACDIGGGFSLMLKVDNALGNQLFLQQDHDGEVRFFELEKEGFVMLGYHYDVKGVGFRSFGDAKVTMFTMYNMVNDGTQVYEVAIDNVNNLTDERSYSGICHYEFYA